MTPPNALTVAFLDSGQGDCTLLVSPKGRLMLVDCGSIKNSKVVLDQIVEALRRYLPAAGNVFDTLVLTHPDQDHYNMLGRVLTETGATVTKVWYGGDRELYRNKLDKNWVYDWLGARNDTQELPNSLYGGNETPMDFDGPKVFMLAANASGDRTAEDGWRVNTNSIVLLVYYGGWKLFLMGDGTSDTEAFIFNSVAAQGPAQILANQHATTLKMGHHGSDTSSAQPWVQALRPQGLVISADTRLFGPTGMPKASHLQQVVGWSGNIGTLPNHGVVFFNDLLPTPRFEAHMSTEAVASTLHAITYNAAGTGFEADGMSWYWFGGSDGSIEVSDTG